MPFYQNKFTILLLLLLLSFSECLGDEGEWHFLSSSPLLLYAKTIWTSSISFYEEKGVRRLVLLPTAPIEDDPRQDYIVAFEKNKYYKLFRKMTREWGCQQMTQLALGVVEEEYALTLCHEMVKKKLIRPYKLFNRREINRLTSKGEKIERFLEEQEKRTLKESQILYLKKLKTSIFDIINYPVHLSSKNPLISKSILDTIGAEVPRVWIDYFDSRIHLVDHHRIHAALEYGLAIVVDVMPPRTTLN